MEFSMRSGGPRQPPSDQSDAQFPALTMFIMSNLFTENPQVSVLVPIYIYNIYNMSQNSSHMGPQIEVYL